MIIHLEKQRSLLFVAIAFPKIIDAISSQDFFIVTQDIISELISVRVCRTFSCTSFNSLSAPITFFKFMIPVYQLEQSFQRNFDELFVNGDSHIQGGDPFACFILF
jgi:hypothetical protein